MNIPECFTLVEHAQHELFGHQRALWLNQLEQAYADLQTALGQLHTQGETRQGLALASGLRELWLSSNRIGEGRAWLNRFLELPLENVPKNIQAQAYDVAGVLAFWQDDRTTADSMMQKALSLRRELDDTGCIAVSLLHLGFNKWILDQDYPAARSLYQQSLALYQQLASEIGVAYAHLNLAHLALAQQDLTAAHSLLKASMGTLRKHEEWWAINFALSDFAVVAAYQGQPERALRLIGANDALRAAFHILVPPVWQRWLEVKLEPARRVQAQYPTALTQGRAMPHEQAVAYALEN